MEENRIKEMKKRNMDQLRRKFKEFSHCHVNDITLETYNKYFETKLKARHVPKTELSDLGRANIDSYVLMK